MRIGVDLGGTKIEAAALDGAGEELARLRIPTPADDYRSTVEAIVRLVEETESRAGGSGTVGVGTPGSISPFTGLLRNSNSQVLNGRPLHRDLEAALGRPVRIENDANCFALSEAVDGAGRDARVVFGVILGTGVGGGVVVERRVMDGPNRIAGEWGHNELAGQGETRSCYCGRSNCVETFLSGPATAGEYRRLTGEERSAEEVMRRVGFDEDARRVLDLYAERLARALAAVVNILDPEVIVLGGGLSNIDALYERVPQEWGKWVFSEQASNRLLPNRHGDSGGVRGAAWLWPPNHH